LTPKEYNLLLIFALNPNITLTKNSISIKLLGYSDPTSYDNDIVKNLVKRLRQKIGDSARDPRYIKTIHGVGYQFTIPSLKSADAEQVRMEV